MHFVLVNLLVTGLMFLGILAMIRIGAWVAHRRASASADGEATTRTSVDGAVYALLGLLIAFTFSGAAERFAWRRTLVVEEANAIGTAYSRIDLLAEGSQPSMRDRFRRYLDARLEAYASVDDWDVSQAALARSVSIQGEIWAEATAGSGAAAHPSCAMLLLPALNAVFDIATTRLAASETHPPLTIFGMLIGMALVSGLLLGNAMGSVQGRSRLHALTYAAVLAVTVFVILDIEYPRQGLIRVDEADQLLYGVRAAMK